MCSFHTHGWFRFLLVFIACGSAFGGESSENGFDEAQVMRYEKRMAEQGSFKPAPGLSPIDRPAPVELSGKIVPTDLSLDASIWLHLPDPTVAPEVFKRRLDITRFGQEAIRREYERIYRQTESYIKEIEQPRKLRLTLSDCLQRALANNYQIKIDGYAPAISTAQIAQAQAAFDLAFFANINRNNTDQPTPSALFAAQTDTTTISGGIRKLLATGATVTLTQSMVRVDNPGFQFNLLNPSYTQSFIAELRQPLLRNFGIDFNRSQINIRKNERKINEEAFRARVIEILVNTEQAYWTLVAARRNVVTGAEILAQSEQTYEQVKARAEFDAFGTLLASSRANVKAQEFNYIDIKNQVRNAEDTLLNTINDPEFPLSADFEIIPVDNPTTVAIVRDHFAAVETALQRRPEIIQTRHGVDVARLQLGIAKNQALPQLDVIYRMTLSGLGPSSDQAFDQMTGGNFVDQFVGLEFGWSPGERAERAGIRIATLQQSQSVLSYKQALDNIITDCRVALRNLETNYEQLVPSYEAMIASAENLRSLQERQERKSPAGLNAVFDAQNDLARARQALLQAAVNYNIGIVDVERAKGTLLEYNNVILAQQP
ncbi:MAG: TolC family protein [Phycisphaerales bacterium]|nr:TolC family protein [Phycisphaerales bacterium]